MGIVDPRPTHRAGIASPLITGRYYPLPGATVTTRQLSQGNVYLGRFVPGRAATLNSIGVEITAAGTTGSLVRLGIYNFNWSNGAMDLLADAGTVDGTVVGFAPLTLSLPVVSGQNLLLACVGQGAPTTQPTVRGAAGVDPMWGFSNGLSASQASTLGVQVIGGATGALPASLASEAIIGGIPRLLVKAA